jgi:hypothetical protein
MNFRYEAGVLATTGYFRNLAFDREPYVNPVHSDAFAAPIVGRLFRRQATAHE